MFDTFCNVPTTKCNMAETARCEKKLTLWRTFYNQLNLITL